MLDNVAFFAHIWSYMGWYGKIGTANLISFMKKAISCFLEVRAPLGIAHVGCLVVQQIAIIMPDKARSRPKYSKQRYP